MPLTRSQRNAPAAATAAVRVMAAPEAEPEGVSARRRQRPRSPPDRLRDGDSSCARLLGRHLSTGRLSTKSPFMSGYKDNPERNFVSGLDARPAKAPPR